MSDQLGVWSDMSMTKSFPIRNKVKENTSPLSYISYNSGTNECRYGASTLMAMSSSYN